MYVLGIETSCDETSCAVVKGRKVLSNVTVSSLKYHRKYGGIIPEIATRNHVKFIDKVFSRALSLAGISTRRIGCIGVTSKPGLIGALLVGLNFAKALSLSLDKPFLGINHLHAHCYAPFLNNRLSFSFPFIGLIVSGGHTEIFLVKDFDSIRIIGKTRDDACGESFDKVARAFGLGYPGGVYIDRMFRGKYKDSFSFNCPRIKYDFSFSGIKTALIYKKMELEKKGRLDKKTTVQVISSFQETVVRTLVDTVCEAALAHKVKRIVCGGGVTANRRFRELMEKAGKNHKIQVLLPVPEFTADNAAMVAGLAFYLYNNKKSSSSLSLQAGD